MDFSFFDEEKTRDALKLMLVPWVVLLAYALYHWFSRRRVGLAEASTLQPFIHFYTLFTSGSSAGYDKEVFQLFHPSLLEKVDRGMIRAMMRYVNVVLGKMVDVPLETAVVKQDGLQRNAVALVHFQNAKNIKCKLHWVLRPSVAQGTRNFDGSIRFHVMSFNVEVPDQGNGMSVVDFLQLDDFISFGEGFLKRLFQPLYRAEVVQMMLPALRSTYEKDPAKLQQLGVNMERTVCAAGGFQNGEFDFTLVESHFLVQPKSGTHRSAAVEPVIVDRFGKEAAPRTRGEEVECSGAPQQRPKGELQGLGQTFHIFGVHRNIEVELRLTLVEMACKVFNFEVRLLPDERQHVLMDRDSGEVQRM